MEKTSRIAIAGFGLALLLTTAIFARTFHLNYLRDKEDKFAFRCHVFNELLRKDMTRPEVEESLGRFGEFKVNEYPLSDGNFQLGILYMDPEVSEHFGGEFTVQFYQYHYFGAFRGYGDNSVGMCEK